MTSTNKIFELAQLSEASYADIEAASVNGIINADKIQNGLDASALFSKSQAEEFALHWKVATYQPDTTSGFSATLFQRIDTNPLSGFQAGQYVYAIRGTMGASDLLGADGGDIVLDGLAIDQIVDLYNDWQRIHAGVGNTYQAAQLVTMPTETAIRLNLSSALLVAYDALMGVNGYIIDTPTGLVRKIIKAPSDQIFETNDSRVYGSVNFDNTLVDVTGHSLGGHLAAAFTRLFGSQAEALTINGAGYATGFLPGLSFNAGNNIANVFKALEGASQFDPTAINNLYADSNPEFITMDSVFGLVQQGHTDAVFTEQNTPWQQTFGHGSGQMTDSLAVYDLFIQLGQDLQMSTAKPVLDKLASLFETASNESATSLENLVNALANLFNIGMTISVANTDNRDEFYQVINAIKSSDTYTSSAGMSEVVILSDPNGPNFLDKAQQTDFEGVAYRYALQTLNPFAIIAANYASHNSKGELELYNPLNDGQGQITEQWLNDRAHLLTQIIHRNSVDSVMLVGGGSNETYQDMATGQLFSTTDVGNVFGPGLPPDSKHIIFGDDNANQDIVGGTKVDHLYGGGGDDIVIGNKGNDYLEGGLGSDIYIYAAGDGFDTIVDIDGLGIITIDGISLDLNDGKKTSPNSWLTQDKQYQLMIGPVNASGQQDLFISNTSLVSDKVSITVKNFTEGDFGISFPLLVQPSVLKPSNVILGDLTPFDFDIEKPGIQSKYDDLGNIITDPNINEPGRNDTINGSAGNDQIEGRLGADILDGLEGNDVLVGGGGRDSIIAGLGNDILYGGDLINIEDLADFINFGGATDDGSYGDFLSADMGDDTLIGSAQSDALMGGEGDDLMIGGAGHDVLFGDATYQTPGSDWTVGGANQAYPAADETSPIWGSGIGLDQVTGLFDTGKGGRDRIYGGSGGDWIIAGREDDVVYGESGMDSIDGGAGNDILLGGEDDDSVNGDLGVGDVTRHGNDYIDLGTGTTEQNARGDGGNDVILGGDTNDTIEGDDLRGPNVPANYHGADYIDGKGGDDTIWGEGADDIIYGGAGNDSLYGDMGTKYVAAAYQGDDILDGGAGNDSIFGDGGNDEIHGGIGNDLLFGDASDVEASAHGDDIIYGDDGDDQLQGGGGNDILNGGTGNDKLLGEDGDDWLSGSDGVDMLMGGAGNDTLEGGAGHDLYFYNLGDGIDTINDHAEIVGVSGVQVGNTLSFGIGIGQNDLSLGLGSLLINLPGGGGIHIEGFDPNNPLANPVIDTFQFADGSLLPYSQLISRGFDIVGTDLDDELNGTATNDRVFGLAGNDKIFASAGADVLYGGAGNDHLDGGLGSDKLIGGLGDDTYYVDSVGDVIEELIEEGIDIVITALGGFTLGPELENLTLIGNSNSGAGNELANRLTGNYVSNVLVGGNGDDWLNGESGNDNLQGGSDNDTYVFGSGFGKDVVFDSDGMADSVEIVGNIASADIALSRNVNDLVLQLPQASDQLILTNWYLPDSRIETINFADGSILDAVAIEQLVVDINLNAQDDSATVVEDIALFANGNVLINDENGTVAGLLAVTNPGQYVGAYGQLNLGADGGYLYQLNNTSEFVQSLAKGQIVVENFKYTITESNKPNVRNGEATLRISIEGSNDAPLTIPDSAELREDLITSVQGNVLANDSDIDNGAALTVKNPGSYTGLYGTFTLDSSGGYSYSLNNSAIEVQSLGANTFVTDTVAYSITDGIEDSSSVLSVQIQGDNDVPMLAQSISDQSGSENQAFRFELPVNTFSDFDNDDVVSISATFADSKPLPSWLEFNTATRVFSGTPTIGSAGVLDIKVIGTDTGGLSASDVFTLTIGNTVDHDHQVIGTHGVDRLEGSKHKDWIEGLGDRDWLYGKRGNDTLWGGDGNDSLDGGSGDDRLFGEVGNDRLLGKQGNDFLDGGLGADVLIGGEGDDYFVVDSAGDIIWESHHEGEDTVASAITYKLSENLENLILTGNAAINGIGNAQNNQLEGNIGGNILNGGSGNDFLDGKEGNDILIGGNGNDTYLFGLGYGTDTVSEHHSRASNSDSTQFLPGISADQLWFRHVSNNLEVSIFGINDKLVIQDWYLGAENHVEWFKTADNKTLSENNVQKLVDAMANLDPSTTGDIVLPLDYQAIYAPVIATYWQ